jgi:hypothetical protein
MSSQEPFFLNLNAEIIPSLQTRSLRLMLKEGFLLYIAHGASFTQPLLRPICFQFAGAFLATWSPYWVLNRLSSGWFSDNPALWIATMLLLEIPGIVLFTMGFWEYLIWMVSLNRNVAEVLQRKQPSFITHYQAIEKQAGPLTNLLLLLSSFWILPIGLIAIPEVVLFHFSPPIELALFLWGSILLGCFSVLLLAVSSIYFSVVFQVFTFEPVTVNPLKLLKRSYDLIVGHFWRVLILMIGMGALTNGLLPGIFTSLLGLSHVTPALAKLLEEFIQEILITLQPVSDTQKDPVWMLISSYTQTHLPQLSIEILNTVFYSVLTALLLPLNTFIFALLYLDLRARKDRAESLSDR